LLDEYDDDDDDDVFCGVVQHVCISINCVECFTSRLIFEVILSQLQQRVSDCIQKPMCTTRRQRCENMNDFVHHLRALVSNRQLSNKCIYIVGLVCLLAEQ